MPLQFAFWPQAARIKDEAATTSNKEICLARFMQFSLPKAAGDATGFAGFSRLTFGELTGTKNRAHNSAVLRTDSGGTVRILGHEQ
jgi:hypothetical protein